MHSLIKALKAVDNSDQLKLDIANDAWRDHKNSPHVPKLIFDWLLGSFFNPRSQACLLSLDAWILLQDIVTSDQRDWLSPSLAQISFAPVLTSCLLAISSTQSISSEDLFAAIYPALRVIWPIVSPRVPVETLLECYSALLNVLSETDAPQEPMLNTTDLIVVSLRQAVQRSQNKKKIFQLFTTDSLAPWLAVSAATSLISPTHTLLVEDIYSSATEIVFAADVLRHNTDQTSGRTLLDAFGEQLQQQPQLKPKVLQILPRLFMSFLESTRRNASAIFAATSGQTNADLVRSSGLDFFATCHSFLSLHDRDVDAWVTLLVILEIVKKERLYTASSNATLTESVQRAFKIFTSLPPDDAVATLALKTVLIVLEIDFVLIEPILDQLLPKLLLCPPSAPLHTVAVRFLTAVLEYHSRCRTIPTYISLLFSCLSEDKGIQWDGETFHKTVLKCPILDPVHCERLATSVNTYVTSGQVPKLLEETTKHLKSYWGSSSLSGQGSKKRNESSKNQQRRGALCLLARLSIYILPSVKILLVMPGQKERLEQDLESWTKSIPLAQLLKQHDPLSDSISASLLQLQYAFVISPETRQKLPPEDEFWVLLTHTVSRPDGIDHELLVECFRLLLLRLAQDTTFSISFTDPLLEHINQNIHSPSPIADGALLLLHIIMDRHLPTIETSASSVQIDKLISIILSIATNFPSNSPPQQNMSRNIITQAFHSAVFWELPRIRSSLLSGLVSRLTILDQLPTSSEPHSLDNLRPVSAVYAILTHIPVEYLTKHTRQELCKKACVLEKLLLSLESSYPSPDVYHTQVCIRVFLYRAFSFTGSVDIGKNSIDFFQGILFSCVPSASNEVHFVSATQEFVNLYVSNILHIHCQDLCAEESLQQIIKTLASHGYDVVLPEQEKVIDVCALELIQIIMDNSRPEDLSAAAQSGLGVLQENMRKQMSSISSLLNEAPLSEHVQTLVQRLKAWRQYVALARWRKDPCSSCSFVGPKLVANLLASDSRIEPSICLEIYSIFLEECVSVPNFSLGAMAAAYVSLSQLVDVPERAKMVRLTAPHLRHSSIDKYSSLCTLVADGLGERDLREGDIPSMLEFCAALLQHAPHGASRSVQQFMGNLLTTIIGNPAFTTGSPSLLLAMLKLISVFSSDFAISLRHLDVEAAFTIIGRLLRPSTSHIERTSPEVYQAITAILINIIRLRRDLVTRLLPHLVHCLSKLLLCLRQVRPQLGGAQRRIVIDSMPHWISANQPLSAAEAQSMSRLLETLAAKTTVRSTSDAPQKAESLTAPFSKHAAYVLKAYINAVNDVLCIVPLAIRTELSPGLFVLCEIMSELNRDALMVSALDAGGKTTLKTLWKEYEAQRYAGKG